MDGISQPKKKLEASEVHNLCTSHASRMGKKKRKKKKNAQHEGEILTMVCSACLLLLFCGCFSRILYPDTPRMTTRPRIKHDTSQGSSAHLCAFWGAASAASLVGPRQRPARVQQFQQSRRRQRSLVHHQGRRRRRRRRSVMPPAHQAVLGML